MDTSIEKSLLLDYMKGTGDSEIISTLITYFADCVPQKIEYCLTTLSQRQNKVVRAQLHGLKNSFANVGALGIANYIQYIECDIENINDQSLLESLEKIKSTHNLVLQNLNDFYSKCCPEPTPK